MDAHVDGGRDADPTPSRWPGTVVIRPEPWTSPAAELLAAELADDIEHRYAHDEEVGGTPDMVELWGLQPEQVVPPGGTLLLAWLDEEAVGCGAVRAIVTGEPGVAELKRIYTVPAVRRRGVSRAILSALEVAAADLGYRHIQLETGLRQPEAIALYESTGWHRIPSYGQYRGDPLSVCFAKELRR